MSNRNKHKDQVDHRIALVGGKEYRGTIIQRHMYQEKTWEDRQLVRKHKPNAVGIEIMDRIRDRKEK